MSYTQSKLTQRCNNRNRTSTSLGPFPGHKHQRRHPDDGHIEDIIQGGAHHNETANKLDPFVSGTGSGLGSGSTGNLGNTGSTTGMTGSGVGSTGYGSTTGTGHHGRHHDGLGSIS